MNGRMHYPQEIIDQYIVESKQYMENIEADILELEETANLPGIKKDLNDKLFRVFHTIKEGASFLGLENISKLALIMEKTLAMIRDHALKPEAVIISALLDGAIHLNVLLDDVNNSRAKNISPIVEKLSSLITGNVSEQVKKELANVHVLSDCHGDQIDFVTNEFTLKKAILGGDSLYVLKYNLMQLDNDKGGVKHHLQTPLRLVRHLQEKGHIIEGRLKVQLEDLRAGLPQQPLVYELLYQTHLDIEELKKSVVLPVECICPVQVPEYLKPNEKIDLEIKNSPSGKNAQKKTNKYPGEKKYRLLDHCTFELFKDIILPQVIQYHPPKSPLRLWLSWIKSGIEIYTIAAIAFDYAQQRGCGFSVKDISLLVTDDDPKALAQAILGKYSKSEIINWPFPGEIEHYFSQEGNIWSIRDHIRSIVDFRQVRVSPSPPYSFSFPNPGPRDFDVIFCFYNLRDFVLETRQAIVKNFHARLVPGGYLVIGQAAGKKAGKNRNEMIISAGFEPIQYHHDKKNNSTGCRIYRKADVISGGSGFLEENNLLQGTA